MEESIRELLEEVKGLRRDIQALSEASIVDPRRLADSLRRSAQRHEAIHKAMHADAALGDDASKEDGG